MAGDGEASAALAQTVDRITQINNSGLRLARNQLAAATIEGER